MKRREVIQALQQSCPDLALLARQWYDRDSKHVISGAGDMARLIEQLHGLDQGCPLSPAFFAITLAPGLDDIARYAQSLDAQSWVYAYLDDIYLVLPRAFVPQVLARTKAMLSQLGLELNEHKTKVWMREACQQKTRNNENKVWMREARKQS